MCRQTSGVVDLAGGNDDPREAGIYNVLVIESAPYGIRPARKRDLPHLAAIEDSGLLLFESVFGDLAGDPLAAPAESGDERAAQPGLLVVAELAADGVLVGFAHVQFLNGHAHLDQLSVQFDHMRQGIGSALIGALCDALSARGYGSVTLLTYADLPWNAAFYAGLGFAEVPGDEPRPAHHVALIAHEEDLDLARHGRRVLMRRTLRTHRTNDELMAYLPILDATPKDLGTLRLLVRRPAVGAREVLEVGVLDLRTGLAGDTWLERGSKRTEDGSAHPHMQLNIMSHPLVAFLAQDPEREALAGDQLFLDLDLSHDNLPAWSELHFGHEGGAIVQVTDQPHNGCGKFIDRYGRDAMAFVNGPEGKPRRLRGLCARVIQPGVVRSGDLVRVKRP